jgi:FkbM family methyltransferase
MAHSVIRECFAQLETELAQADASPLFSTAEPVFIYGAGNVGKDVFGLLTRRGIPIAGFLDRQAKPGSVWKGIPIRQADDPSILLKERQCSPVIMGIFNAYVEMPPIMRMLHDLGYTNITSYLKLHERFSSEFGDRYWLTSRSYYMGLEPLASAGYELWGDDASRELYASILRFRFTMDYECVPTPDVGQQYFPADLPQWRTPLRFVDCGAYNGDTLAQVLDTGLQIEAIAAFEPDETNFVALANYINAKRPALPGTVCLFPCGVDSATSQVRFSAGQGPGSHISASGDTVVQCVSLDEALPCFRPTLIKMDVEGAEAGALWGARRLLAEHRPGLAISLYHRPQHLWQIPLLVRQLCGTGGRYFLRESCFNGFELVLYWFPE